MEEPEEDLRGEMARMNEKQEQDSKSGVGTMADMLDTAIQADRK